MPDLQYSQALLEKYISNPSLRNHCEMVGKAMAAYAKHLGLTDDQVEQWQIAGLLHDLDWEQYPDEHPLKATREILPAEGYSQEILDAIDAHGESRTGKKPETDMEKYLFACDELSGFLNAASLMRPNKFADMEVKSIMKRLKDKSFAANVSRDDIRKGAELIGKPIEEHVGFLIGVFR